MRVPVELRWFLQLSFSWFMLHKVIKQGQQFLHHRADWQTNRSTFCRVGAAFHQRGWREPSCTWPSALLLSGSKTNWLLIVLFQLMRRPSCSSHGTVHLSAAPSPYSCDGLKYVRPWQAQWCSLQWSQAGSNFDGPPPFASVTSRDANYALIH